MTKKKSRMRIRKDSVVVEGTRTLEFEESELEKINIERVVNKIKNEFEDLINNR